MPARSMPAWLLQPLDRAGLWAQPRERRAGGPQGSNRSSQRPKGKGRALTGLQSLWAAVQATGGGPRYWRCTHDAGKGRTAVCHDTARATSARAAGERR